MIRLSLGVCAADESASLSWLSVCTSAASALVRVATLYIPAMRKITAIPAK